MTDYAAPFRRQIAQLDLALSLASVIWREAEPNSKRKTCYRQTIDRLLDQRFRLMTLRDALGKN